MAEFKNRVSTNPNKKYLLVESVERNNVNDEIEKLVVFETRADNAEEENEGTALNASSLNEVVDQKINDSISAFLSGQDLFNLIMSSVDQRISYHDAQNLSLEDSYSGNFNLPRHGRRNSIIEWTNVESDQKNYALIENDVVKITRDQYEHNVPVIATVSFRGKTNIRELNIKVAAMTNMECVEDAYERIVILESKVTEDFALPMPIDKEVQINWSSSNTDAINCIDGYAYVTRDGDETIEVILSAEITKGEYTRVKTFNITVDMFNDEEKALLDITILPEFLLPITDNFELQVVGPDFGTPISWASNNSAITIDLNGYATVTRSPVTSIEVILTADVGYGIEPREFEVIVAQREYTEEEKAELDLNNLPSLPSIISNDFELLTSGRLYGTVINWSEVGNSGAISIDSNGYVSVTRSTLASIEVILTASALNTSEVKTFVFVVPQREMTNEEKVDAAYDNLELSVTSSTSSFTLPLNGEYGASIYWTCDRSDVINIDGSNAYVTQTADNETIELVANIEIDDYPYFRTKSFFISVPRDEQKAAQADRDEINFDTLYVVSNFELPFIGNHGSTISWVTDKPYAITIIDNIAHVTRRLVDHYVTLEATITYGEYSYTRAFEFVVIAREKTDLEKAHTDIDWISIPTSVDDDFTLPVVGSQYGYAITWSSNDSDISISSTGYATVYRRTYDVVVTLTASAYNGQATKDFLVTIIGEPLPEPDIVLVYDVNSLHMYWAEKPDNASESFTVSTRDGESIWVEITNTYSEYYQFTVSGNGTSSVTITVEEIVKPDINEISIFDYTMSIYDEDSNLLCSELGSIFYN